MHCGGCDDLTRLREARSLRQLLPAGPARHEPVAYTVGQLIPISPARAAPRPQRGREQMTIEVRLVYRRDGYPLVNSHQFLPLPSLYLKDAVSVARDPQPDAVLVSCTFPGEPA